MNSFTDKDGRRWSFVITVSTLKRVQALVGVDLGRLNQPQLGRSEPLLTELQSDIVLLGDAMFAVLKPEADRMGVGDEQFAALMDGDTYAVAHEAFWETLADFFRRQPQRKAMAAVIEKQIAITKAAMQEAEARLGRIDPGEQIEKAFGPSSGDAPGSAGSIPAPSPCES